jgi:hypothetical protein
VINLGGRQLNVGQVTKNLSKNKLNSFEEKAKIILPLNTS